MKPLDCPATRRRLNAFHDRELSVSDQIAVGSHLEWCEECATFSTDLRLMGTALQRTAPGRASLPHEDAVAFATAVVSRLQAEQEVSLAARLRGTFDDLHLVYAGLGGAAATVACVVVMFGLMWFAADERPNSDRAASLAAMVDVLATPGTSGNPIAIDGEMHARWTALFRQANETAEQDAVFALSAVVARQGRLTTLRPGRGGRRSAVSLGDAQIIDALLDVVSRARFEGMLEELRPSGLVRLLARTTVYATKPPALDLRVPAPKKRAASATDRRLSV